MVSFLETLQEVHQKERDRPFTYWRSHPYISQRIAQVRAEITGKMEFDDYLNLKGEE
jgi:predicted Zn-dependent protease